MKILVACEFSGVVTEAFRKRGHDAWSCDLLPSEGTEFHIQDDALDLAYNSKLQWDMMIAHPPCTYLASSGLHWNKRIAGRDEKTNSAISFVLALANAPIAKIAIENPVGCLSTRWRKPDQIIQPWMFGHPEAKATCLWLENLPFLLSTDVLEPRNGDPRRGWDNQTPTGQNKYGPSPDRWKKRSITYPGIADAMAKQWG